MSPMTESLPAEAWPHAHVRVACRAHWLTETDAELSKR